MKVTRITIDHELGLINLETGPGGDGDYVLLPLEISEALQRYVRLAGEPCNAEPPNAYFAEQTMENPSPEFVSLISGNTGAIVAAGGWSVPKDQAYDFNTTDGLSAYGADLAYPPQAERGGIKFTRSTEPQNLHDEAAEEPRERHTGPATVPNPITVIAHEHSRGYRLTCPSLPRWKEDINQYNLHLAPDLIRAGVKTHRGYEVDAYKVSIIIEEMEK